MKDCKTVLSLSTRFLEQHKITRPRFIAESLLSHFLGMRRIELYMYFDRPIQEQELIPFREALKRASKKEPLEYILGEIEFYSTNLKVNSDVLIPRHETEILVDLVCKNLTTQEKMGLDLCTGSGCIAIAIKKAYPQIAMTGVDLSSRALAVAKGNSSNIRWLQGDLTEPVQGEKFDFVVCNPPYISEDEYQNLEDEVQKFEPKMALVAGSSGLEFYERLQKDLPAILSPGAKVFFEIGATQGEKIKKIFSNDRWQDLNVIQDWAGHNRFFFLKLKQNSSIIQ